MFSRLMAVLALLALPLAGCGDDEPDPLPVRIAAFLDSDQTVRPDAVQARIRALPEVTSVAFVTRQEAYERLQKSLKDNPEALAGTKPESLPESLEVIVADGKVAEAVQLAIGAFDGVSQTTLAAGDGDVERYEQVGVLVRLTAGATDEQRGAIEQVVRGLPRTEGVTYETGEQTKARLKQRCKGELATALEQVSTLDIPRSFRLRVGLHGGKIPQLADLQRLAGVGSMVFVPVEVV